MAWFVVRSPHDGREVKVRDKDVGRSVRDGEGRIFYVLEKEDGSGRYGSLTRQGGPEQEAAYDQLLAKEGHTQALAEEATERVVHDARGKPRSTLKGKLILLIIIGALAAAGWAVTMGPLKGLLGGGTGGNPGSGNPPANQPADP